MATRAGVEEYSTSPRAQRSRERSIRASWTTGYWGADASIRASISTRFATTDVDDAAGQLARSGIGLDLRQLALEDRGRGPLAELRLEDRRERDPPAGAQRPDAVAGALSHRRRRPGRSPPGRAGPAAARPPARRRRGRRRPVSARSAPGRAMIRSLTRTPSSRTRTMIGGPASAARQRGPRRATRRTSGTSSAARRATSTMTPRPTDRSGRRVASVTCRLSRSVTCRLRAAGSAGAAPARPWASVRPAGRPRAARRR